MWPPADDFLVDQSARQDGGARKIVLVYKRYVSLYVILGVDPEDNRLMMDATIHHFVEILDAYFGTVRELDLIYNFVKAYMLLDEFICGGYVILEDKDEVIAHMADIEAAMKQSAKANKRTGRR